MTAKDHPIASPKVWQRLGCFFRKFGKLFEHKKRKQNVPNAINVYMCVFYIYIYWYIRNMFIIKYNCKNMQECRYDIRIYLHTYCEAGWPTGPVSERHILDLPPGRQGSCGKCFIQDSLPKMWKSCWWLSLGGGVNPTHTYYILLYYHNAMLKICIAFWKYSCWWQFLVGDIQTNFHKMRTPSWTGLLKECQDITSKKRKKKGRQTSVLLLVCLYEFGTSNAESTHISHGSNKSNKTFEEDSIMKADTLKINKQTFKQHNLYLRY